MIKHKLYSVENTGRQLRVFTDAFGKRVTLLPGKTLEGVPLKDRTAQAIYRAQSGGGTLHLKAADYPEDVRAHDFARKTETEADGDTGGEIDPGNKKAEIAKLLADIEGGMAYTAFYSRAKRIIGDEWPQGNPRKRDIVAMLQSKLDEE